MNKTIQRFTVGGAALALAAGLAAWGLQATAQSADASALTAAMPAGTDAQFIKRGEYLARAGDCVACHSAPGGKPFAGGLPMNSPFGTIYSTNITPDPTHGIGRDSFEDFDKAVRHGIRRDGKPLYPAMPYPSFAKITTDDMRALYAYFMHGVAPVAEPDKRDHLMWPANLRVAIHAWNWLFTEAGEYQPDPAQDAQWNRGAYLVQGLGHCGACHTPRGIAEQEKALSNKDGAHYLGGASLDNWYAPTLAGNLPTGLKDWAPEQIAQYLKTGRTEKTAVFGAMADVVQNSTQYMTDADLHAIGVYLKSLTGKADTTDHAAVAMAATAKPDANAVDPATAALRAGNLQAVGARLYVDNCAACHRSDGKGASKTFLALAGNPVVIGNDPTSLIHIVLKGGAMPSTEHAPTALAMPDFAWRLTDQQVADVLTFIRGSWGNQAPAVSAQAVERLRKSTDADPAGKPIVSAQSASTAAH
jgi:mono/diheme cytochrome c family protein